MCFTFSPENKQTNKQTSEQIFLNAKPLWFGIVQLNNSVNVLLITTVTLPLKVAIKTTS